MHLKYFVLLLFLLTSSITWAQPANDECTGAIELSNVTDYCSNPGEFSTIGATDSGNNPMCFPNGVDVLDVWFSFTAIANTININVLGNVANNAGGTLVAPQLAVYTGDCINGLVEFGCFSDAFGNNFSETFLPGLTPGQTYYVQVSARLGGSGSFQLCLSNFNSPPEPSGDCVTGVILCDKSSFSVDYVLGGGNDTQELDGASCLVNCGGAAETSSAWYKWTCDQSGTLSFVLTPNNPNDDLDFILYELPNGIDNCNSKNELRCMASGENTGQPLSDWIGCYGPTGLQIGDPDTGEECGCQSGNNNFVAAIDMIAGQSYALAINNFSNSSAGFSIDFGGTGTFLGPEVGFDLNPDVNIECDQSIVVLDASSFGAGAIVGWSWFFGAGATPAAATTPGPHTVAYESFGEKFVTLTVESDGGCFVTETIPVNVEECCVLPSDLRLELVETIDPLCNGEASGSIVVAGFEGDPEYLYSINNGTSRSFPVFTNLTAGSYDVLIQDIKGCQTSIQVDLVDPPPVIVDAGPDITVDLGETVNLNAIAGPTGTIAGFDWNSDTTLSCNNCSDPTAFPLGSTEYVVNAFNDDGCSAEDRVRIIVRDNRPIYIPNAISPNNDGINDLFHIFGNNAALEITTLRIFNRWGAMVYEENNLPLGENSRGWDGTFKGEILNPDVFVFYAVIRFIDNKEILYEGDITIIR